MRIYTGRRLGGLASGRHSEPHAFTILLEQPMHYGGHKLRGTVLNELAKHFAGHLVDLQALEDSWEKIHSARMYGLVDMPNLPMWQMESGLENLHELISRIRWLEESNSNPRPRI